MTVLDAIRSLDTIRGGALVTFKSVRPLAVHLDKKDFDMVVRSLVALDEIALTAHDFPGSLTPQEREQLVRIGSEYFIGCSIR